MDNGFEPTLVLVDADGMSVDIVGDGAPTTASTGSTYSNIENANGHSSAGETASIPETKDSFEYSGMVTMYFNVKVRI